jgi:RecA/RadA recombinase
VETEKRPRRVKPRPSRPRPRAAVSSSEAAPKRKKDPEIDVDRLLAGGDVPPPDWKALPELDAVLEEACANYRRTAKHGVVMTVNESSAFFIGLPVPMGLEWLLGLSALPLGATFLQLAGEKGIGKSSLIIALISELERWPCRAGFIGTEHKFSPSQVKALLGVDSRCLVVKANSQDDWHRVLDEFATGYLVDRAGNPEMSKIALVAGVDSISGSLAETVMAKIQKDGGVTSTRYAKEAAANTDFFKYLTAKIEMHPSVILATNHLKKSISSVPGVLTRSVPGGAHLGFQASFEIDVKRIQVVARTRTVDRGNVLVLKTHKNSLAEDRRELVVPVTWRYRSCEGDEARRHLSTVVEEMRVDWRYALTSLLTRSTEAGGAKELVQDVLDLRVVKGPKGRKDFVASDRLAVSESNPLSFSEAGAVVESDPELRRELRRALGVLTCHVFDYRIGWEAQIEALRRVQQEAEHAATGRTIVTSADRKAAVKAAEAQRKRRAKKLAAEVDDLGS